MFHFLEVKIATVDHNMGVLFCPQNNFLVNTRGVFVLEKANVWCHNTQHKNTLDKNTQQNDAKNN
jgi:hypothetical protein